MKKNLKKLFLLMAVVLISVVCFAFSSQAIARVDYDYHKNGDTVEIFGYLGESTDIEIPSEIDGRKVTSIADSTFSGHSRLTSVVIPEGVTKIGEEAFSFCPKLTSVTIPESVKTIGSGAFLECPSLTTVNLPGKLTKISSSLFSHCTSLKNIIIPDGIKSIGEYAFEYCTNLEQITIPESVTSIGDYAFRYCSSFTDIKIPDGVKKLEWETFKGCSSLKNVTLSSNLTEIGGDGVFAECVSLESITLPDSLTKIGYSAFAGCTALETVKLSETLISISDFAFDGCVKLKNISVPDSLVSLCSYAFRNCRSIESITIPYKVTVLDGSAFIGCDNLKSLTIYTYSEDVMFSVDWELSTDCIIYGFKGTVSEWIAKKSGVTFVDVETVHTHTNKTTTTKATLTKNGSIAKQCSDCGYAKTTVVYKPTSFKLSKTEYTYNSKVQTPSVTVKDSEGNTLKKDTDYTVKYESGRKMPGKYTLTITFKGNYTGTKKLTFTIKPRVTTSFTATQTTKTITLKWSKVTGADAYRVYKYNSKTKKFEKLKDVTDTSLKIADLKAGTVYKYKVRAITKDDGSIYGAYSSELATATKCKTPVISSVYSKEKGKAVVKWSNVSGESGYQLYYAASKNGTYKKVNSYVADKTAGSKTKLTSMKTYYFKVRAYKKTACGTVYSSWSAVKSVKIK